MQLTQRFTAFIKEKKLFSPTDLLLLAVSGGVDSVVLCELCKEAGYPFMIAHCNFQLRGEESRRDEQFVLQLAKDYGVTALNRSFETEQYAQEKKVSIQVAARELRYEWFNALIDEENTATPADASDMHLLQAAGQKPHYILTAHHADDNIETMLMNFFKGTGITGMRGMLPKQGRLIRPLLFAHKAALKAFAGENNIAYVEDASNASDKYTRNFFRNQLMPSIQKVFPAVEDNLHKNLQRFSEAAELYHQAVAQHKKKLLHIKGNEVHIPILLLQKSSPLETLIYEITKDFGFSPQQAKEVMDLLSSESGRLVQSASYRVIKHRNWLVISPVNTLAAAIIVINAADQVIEFENGTLRLQQLPVSDCCTIDDAATAQLDAACVSFPLLLRKRGQGDYFYPLGMPKKKKVSRFLSDLKLSVPDKEKTWVLESSKKIVWVVGRRIDDRFKITPQTKTILQITFTASS